MTGGANGCVLVGVDVGATTIAAGLVTESGDVVALERVATHERGRGTAVPLLLDVIAGLLRGAGRDGRSAVAIGIGLPGIVDAGQGMMVGDENFVPEFADVPLASNLRSSTGLPVFVDNDANALALGEFEWGLGRGVASMVLLAIGTGVGGAIVVAGQLVRGHSGSAGEFGHVSIDFDGPRCQCGGRGCLNQYVGGEALAQAARTAVARDGSSTILVLAGGDLERITSRLIFEAAEGGDAVAIALVQRACVALGAAIAGIVNSLNPELVVVTGGVAASLAPLEGQIVERAGRYAIARALARTSIRVVSADKRRTVLGGAALALAGLRRAAPLVVSGVSTGNGEAAAGIE